MKAIDGIRRDNTIAKLKARIEWLEKELEIARKEADEPCLRPHVTDVLEKNLWPFHQPPGTPYRPWYQHPDIILCHVGGGPTII